MTKTNEIKKKGRIKRNKRIAKIAIPLILLMSIFIDKLYHRTFYTHTDARVIFCETKIVGLGSSPLGSTPIGATTISVEYVAHDGIMYTATLSANSRSYVAEGSIVTVKYKNSNPEKCYLD